MTILFVGGEDSDVNFVGATSVLTTGSNAGATRRTTYARSTFMVTMATDFVSVPLGTPQTSFWLTARHNIANIGVTSNDMILFCDGATTKFVLKGSDSSPTRKWVLYKNGVLTGSLGLAIACDALVKLDIYVSYAVSGRLTVYSNGVQVFDYSGDLTSSGSSTLDSVKLSSLTTYNSTYYSTHWSELIAATTDTRSLGLATLPPLANGNAQSWTGAVTDINEITLSDATAITSATANQIAEFTISNLGAITATTPIVGLSINARASRGSTGPQNAQLVTRIAATDYVSPTQSLTLSLAPVTYNFLTNPATSTAWSGADLLATGFNIGIKSIT